LGGSYELLNNTSKNISNLKSGNDYFFFIKTNQYDIISLNLTMNNLSYPFIYIYYQELSKREESNNNLEKIQSISQIIKGNQLIISISQNISKSSTNYINFKFSPSYNIDNMIAKINIVECLIDLITFRETKNLYNLKSNVIYYIKLLAWWDSFTILNLTVYNATRNPFSYIRIYECISTYNSLSFCERITTNRYPEFSRQNNQYKTTIKNNNEFNTAYDIYIEIRPNYDISYMLAETEVVDLRKSYSKFSVILIIFIILSAIILVVIIIFIILRCRRSNSLNSIKSIETPLYLNDQNNQNELITPD